jgi:hypothetical protein
MKKVIPPIVVALLLAIGITLIVKPDLIPLGSLGTPVESVIIREAAPDKPYSQEMIELYAGATKLGIGVWDDNVLGPGKKPSEKAKPFLEAAAGKDLPVLVSKWPNGSYTAKACPTTLSELEKATGKVVPK